MAKIYKMPRQHSEEETPCLTFNQIMDYINDRLSPQEKLQADKHLQECNLCRDAIEAAEAYPNKEELPPYVESVGSNIRRAIEAQSGARQPDRRLYYRIAAIFVITVTSIFYFTRERLHEQLFAEYFEPYHGLLTVVRSKATQGDLQQAALHYDAGEFAEALPFFEAALQSQPSDTVRFCAGISYLATNDPESAITSLQKVLDDESSGLRKHAEWYLALAYLQKNDLQNARSLLRNVVSSESANKDKAVQLLDRLDGMTK